ncbi:MAG: DUF427 domain-containing protein [Actinomycetia bacterium]|nr:DUF427 domain-containing protein [Actinomycetes bacterium]
MSRGRVRIEDGQKRVRVYLGGEVIADTVSPKLVWEKPYYPVYYFPQDDVRMDSLLPTEHTKRSPSRGTAEVFDVKSNRQTSEQGAYRHTDSPIEELRDHVAFDWQAMDAWFEEEEEVFLHARDPYTRVDVLQSSRNIRVEVDGVTVAESDQPRILFETGLPARYYLPKTDVRFEYLTPTDLSTVCPYKGTSRYWSINTTGEVHDNLAWGYDAPVRESQPIAGYVAFYNEKLDIYVDGVLEEKPKTVFS